MEGRKGSPEEGLAEVTPSQKGRSHRDGTAGSAVSVELSVQTQNSAGVCAGRLSQPADSSPDRVGLQSKSDNDEQEALHRKKTFR